MRTVVFSRMSSTSRLHTQKWREVQADLPSSLKKLNIEPNTKEKESGQIKQGPAAATSKMKRSHLKFGNRLHIEDGNQAIGPHSEKGLQQDEIYPSVKQDEQWVEPKLAIPVKVPEVPANDIANADLEAQVFHRPLSKKQLQAATDKAELALGRAKLELKLAVTAQKGDTNRCATREKLRSEASSSKKNLMNHSVKIYQAMYLQHRPKDKSIKVGKKSPRSVFAPSFARLLLRLTIALTLRLLISHPNRDTLPSNLTKPGWILESPITNSA